MQPSFSIIVNNYNYSRYLRECIGSALSQTYGGFEVIVVDDGSTDDSAQIIAEFGSAIYAVLKRNGGQASAFNAGFKHATGDLVLFLDADDFLYSNCLSVIAELYNERCAKYHFRLDCVNSQGLKLGKTIPRRKYRLASGEITRQYLDRAFYVTPPTSGNVFSSAALAHIFPIDEENFRICADALVNSLIVFHGELCAVDTALGAYRLHGKNSYASASRDFERELRLDIARQDAIRVHAHGMSRIAARDCCFRTATHRLKQLWANHHGVDLPSYLRARDREVLAAAFRDIAVEEFSLARKAWTFAAFLFLFARAVFLRQIARLPYMNRHG